MDLEVAAAHVFGPGLPPSTIRWQLDGYWPTVVLVTLAVWYYFYLVPIYFPSTKPQTPKEIARTHEWRNWHNASLFVYSAASCAAALSFMIEDGSFTSLDRMLCSGVQGTWMRPVSALFTLSKLWEWIDTAFLVWLGRSPPQFLHTYHHATTFWLFLFVMNLPCEKCGVLLNGFVHTLMYHHYWKPWPKRFVPWITLCQILQLVTVTYLWTLSPFVCGTNVPWSDLHVLQLPWKWNRIDYWTFVTPYAMVPVFLYYFVAYFVKRFVWKKPKAA